MYVKLAFAVESHLDAEIMIMDEVLAVGDMAFQKKCFGKMGDEAHGGKLSSMLVTTWRQFEIFVIDVLF